MSLNLPAEFDSLKYQNAGSASLVVTITNGAGDVFYFCEKNIYLSTGSHVHGELIDISPVTHGYDYNSLEYQPARVTVVLGNVWSSRNVAGDHERNADRIPDGSFASLWGQSISVRWFSGGYADLISELKIFDGRITGVQTDGDSRLVIQADEIWSLGDRNLPRNTADTTEFPKIDPVLSGTTLPLVYGAHTENEYLRSAGFAEGLRVEPWKWVFADHPCYAFYEEPRASSAANLSAYTGSSKALWIYVDKVKSWARSYVGVTFSTNDDGRATATIDPDAAGWDVYLYPTKGTLTSTGTDSGNPVGPIAAFDFDSTSKASVIANSTTQAIITFEFDIAGGADGANNPDQTPAEAAATNDLNNDVAALPGPATALYGFDMYATKPGGITISSASVEYWGGTSWLTISSSVVTSASTLTHYTSATYSGDIYGNPDSIRWHFNTGRSRESGTSPDQTPLKIRVVLNGSGWTADSTVVAYIHECRIVQSCQTPRNKSQIVGKKAVNYRVDERNLLGQKTGRKVWKFRYEDMPDIDSNVFGASLQGRMYGSWIDDGGRSNSFDEAVHQITHAAGVVESILCDELGHTINTVDQASFDDMYAASDTRSIAYNIKPGARRDSRDLIQSICYEHDMLLYRARGSTAKYKICPGTGRTAFAGTVKREEMFALPEIGLTDFRVKNKVTFWYRRLPHDNAFFKNVTYEDTLSTAAYGTLTDDIYLDTIVDVSQLNPIRSRLIEDQYMLSRAHYLVSFNTIGHRWAELELGDRIGFDADSMDPVMKLFGGTWSGIYFIIYEVSTHKAGNAFKAISKSAASI